tara:strand:- start:67 stop:240 length:174 start_codon:yes stop_codon:yes gene_type:complete
MISISLLLFIMGVLFIIIGYTKQITPSCKKGEKIKLVDRNLYENIIGLETSHQGSVL